MSKKNKPLQQILNLILGSKASLLYILLFAVAVGAATFVENDFGTDSAQKVIYKSTWFEVLLFLFASSLVFNMLRYRLIQRKMWSVLCFHLSILFILLGAGLTRFLGFEGMMHIRENDQSNQFLSSEGYIKVKFFQGGNDYGVEEPVLWSSLGSNNFNESYQIGGELISVKLKDLYINPSEKLEAIDEGIPILKVVFGSDVGREEYFLEYGKSQRIGGVPFYFGPGLIGDAFSINLNEAGYPEVYSSQPYSFMRMADQSLTEVAPDTSYELALRSLYRWGGTAFVFGDFSASARIVRSKGDLKILSNSLIGMDLEISNGSDSKVVYIEGNKGFPGQPAYANLGDWELGLSYGSKVREIPFSIKLNDFQMERYPGTNSPASFASEVQLIDPAASTFDFRIYMNNILNYKGYRFFQSSYDRDEEGTYLSVNHDFWGTTVSYLGYALLTLGMLWTLLARKTRFSTLAKQIKEIRKKRAFGLLAAFLFSSSSLLSQTTLETNLRAVHRDHAALFSTILVQDVQGRMKPMHTLSREVLRKLTGKESYRDLNADQLLLSIWANNSDWYSEAMIKLPYHPRFEEMGFAQERHAYKEFFNLDGSYKLVAEVQAANAVIDKEKGTWEKALLKLDEKVNIFNMMLSGYLLKVVPLEGDPNNTWVSVYPHGDQRSVVADRLFPTYKAAIMEGLADGDFSKATSIVVELKKYQNAQNPDLLPSESQRTLEIWLNELKIFNRLALVYSLLGMAFLTTLFLQIFKPTKGFIRLHSILLLLMIVAFLFHTMGLGFRWYVSGRAPWSNGYESMIYIAWTATLAGLLFSRKASGALAATNVLSGVVLLIAMLSYLNPEITPLVPVLRSYWLTIHVSLEAGSYGFLMLGALIGVIDLVLMIFLTKENQSRIKDVVREMTKLSEMTLIGGLFMLSVGTYLGGVWANESWGRYWGWDAKETWALVSILVYAFILHMRFVPKLAGLYTFNFATLFGLASIIMTYYGVNYYLSGLHSYAAGDPVPVPAWVYWSIASLLLISGLAYWRQQKVWGSKS